MTVTSPGKDLVECSRSTRCRTIIPIMMMVELEHVRHLVLEKLNGSLQPEEMKQYESSSHVFCKHMPC